MCMAVLMANFKFQILQECRRNMGWPVTMPVASGPGHRREFCRSPITCHNCKQSGHIASGCRGLDRKVGFQPKIAPVDCFLRKEHRKGKEIDTTQWFKGKSHGPASSAPRIYQSFMEYAQTLLPGGHRDSRLLASPAYPSRPRSSGINPAH
jgi:hypothetical protein